MKALKWTLRIALGLIVLVSVLALAGYAYVEVSYDKDYASVALPEIEASRDPEVIAHGEYVANALAHCSACHAPGEYDKPRRLPPRHDMRGGMRIPVPMFGTFFPANISSDATGVKNVSDGELARAIRHGVDRHGKLVPVMRFAVGPMSDEDLRALISYVRTLPAHVNKVPPDEYEIIAKVLLLSLAPTQPKIPPYVARASGPAGISIERGRYLANGPAFCFGCHTGADPFNGFAPTGPLFSGEPMAEPDPTDHNWEFVVPNLTPDPKTGIIAAWPEDAFVQRFRNGRVYAGSKMPWESFQQMSEEDLRSIYRYLRTLPKIVNDVGPSRRQAGWKG